MSILNIVVPMAGHGSRFRAEGYPLPKPLIPIHGTPMIAVVINNIRPTSPHRFIFLCLQEHLDRYGLLQTLRTLAPHCVVVPVTEVTAGAACTVLLARDLIDNDNSLMIANADQYVDTSIDRYLAAMGSSPKSAISVRRAVVALRSSDRSPQ